METVMCVLVSRTLPGTSLLYPSAEEHVFEHHMDVSHSSCN